jgi:hypothetical protein
MKTIVLIKRGDKMMRFNSPWHFILTCCALAVLGLLFVACGASPHLEKTATTLSFDEEFSSALVDGEEFSVPAGQAIVMYADHLPQAGGSGDAAVANTELENQLKILDFSPSFKQIPAVWGLLNDCTYTMYVDAYYVGTLHITVVDARLAHQIVAKWKTDNQVATHYVSENEIPCLAA